MRARRGRTESLTLSRFVPMPGNCSGLAAVQELLDGLAAGRQGGYLVFVHGPPGTGKTHLAWGLVDELTRLVPAPAANVLSALDFPRSLHDPDDQPFGNRLSTEDIELLIVEDLQQLPLPGAQALADVLDSRAAHQLPTLLTARVGPGMLTFLPARLRSRLGGGLVVRLESFSPASRFALLQDRAQRRQLAIHPDVLTWLAHHLHGNGRQILAALDQVESLALSQPGPLDLGTVAYHFRRQGEKASLSMGQIVKRVGHQFQVDAGEIQSRRRHRQVLLPRQVSMYLARRLTGLSLGEIGAYFGGRDHSTVLHACRKVERAIERDVVLSGAVQVLEGELL
jgi:chromosomal replication initiator protein